MAVDLSRWERERFESVAASERPVLVLDPGHGGTDPGAVGPSGLRECDVALAVCLAMRVPLLELGWQVLYTRSDDRLVSLVERCRFSNSVKAQAFVSVHANSFYSHTAHGFEVWTSPGDTPADPIATSIYNAVVGTFPDAIGRPDLGDGDPDKEARFKVLTGTFAAAVLVETAFISNPREEAWLADPGWRMRMAGAIVSGIGRAT